MQNDGPQNQLVWLELPEDNGRVAIRPITAAADGSQYADPAFDPSGERLAVSVWKPGGFRDIHVLDSQPQPLRAISWDRASDIERPVAMLIGAWPVAFGNVLYIANAIHGAVRKKTAHAHTAPLSSPPKALYIGPFSIDPQPPMNCWPLHPQTPPDLLQLGKNNCLANMVYQS